MQIITDGKEFAIKRGFWIFTELADLKTFGFWWRPNHSYQADCWGSLDEVLKALRLYKRSQRIWKVYKRKK